MGELIKYNNNNNNNDFGGIHFRYTSQNPQRVLAITKICSLVFRLVYGQGWAV